MKKKKQIVKNYYYCFTCPATNTCSQRSGKRPRDWPVDKEFEGL